MGGLWIDCAHLGHEHGGSVAMTLLDVVLALPLVGFLLVLLIPREQHQTIRGAALIISLAVFLGSLRLAVGFQADTASQQFINDRIWIASPEIHYHVGVDGISLWLVLLSTLLTPLCIFISWRP